MAGAAGAMGIVTCILAVARQEIPPTANLLQSDPECDLDYVPGHARPAPGLSMTMANAFGFGGTAASLVIRAPQ